MYELIWHFLLAHILIIAEHFTVTYTYFMVNLYLFGKKTSLQSFGLQSLFEKFQFLSITCSVGQVVSGPLSLCFAVTVSF